MLETDRHYFVVVSFFFCRPHDFSWHQLENANLLALREASLDSSAAPPYFNELLNHACTVGDFLLRPGRRQVLVLVFYPCLQVRSEMEDEGGRENDNANENEGENESQGESESERENGSEDESECSLDQSLAVVVVVGDVFFPQRQQQFFSF